MRRRKVDVPWWAVHSTSYEKRHLWFLLLMDRYILTFLRAQENIIDRFNTMSLFVCLRNELYLSCVSVLSLYHSTSDVNVYAVWWLSTTLIDYLETNNVARVVFDLSFVDALLVSFLTDPSLPRRRRVSWLQRNLLMAVTKPCNWPSRFFVGINGTKFLCLWVFGNIFCPCFKTSYKSGFNDHGCVLECPSPPPLAILGYLIFVPFLDLTMCAKCQKGIGKIGIIFLYLRNNSNPNHLLRLKIDSFSDPPHFTGVKLYF